MQLIGNMCVTPPMALTDSHSMRKALGITENKTFPAENVTDHWAAIEKICQCFLGDRSLWWGPVMVIPQGYSQSTTQKVVQGSQGGVDTTFLSTHPHENETISLHLLWKEKPGPTFSRYCLRLLLHGLWVGTSHQLFLIALSPNVWGSLWILTDQNMPSVQKLDKIN